RNLVRYRTSASADERELSIAPGGCLLAWAEHLDSSADCCDETGDLVSLNGDIEGAVRVAKVAMGLSWVWTDEDIERFRSALGWGIHSRLRESCTLATDLEINIAHADVTYDRSLLGRYGGIDESVLEVSVYVTDVANDRAEQLRELFGGFADRLIREIGEPDELVAGEKVAWLAPNAMVGLWLSEMSITLKIENPRYRRWDADCEWYEDRAELDPLDE
ncbi:DUF6301 family protein, partial [Nocardia tengchongensis]